MKPNIQNIIFELYHNLPDFMRREPASEEEIEEFEAQFGEIPRALKWFLEQCGGGIIGSEYVDDIRELFITHQKYRQESQLEQGWTMKNVFVIGWDGSGNPYGIDTVTGKIVVEDHDFSGVHEVAESLGEFLLRGLQGK